MVRCPNIRICLQFLGHHGGAAPRPHSSRGPELDLELWLWSVWGFCKFSPHSHGFALRSLISFGEGGSLSFRSVNECVGA